MSGREFLFTIITIGVIMEQVASLRESLLLLKALRYSLIQISNHPNHSLLIKLLTFLSILFFAFAAQCFLQESFKEVHDIFAIRLCILCALNNLLNKVWMFLKIGVRVVNKVNHQVQCQEA